MAKPTKFQSVKTLTNRSRRPESTYKKKGSKSKKEEEKKGKGSKREKKIETLAKG